ncbi:MAG: YdcH family protein [Alphaproteobacteria bacterium]
MSDPTQDELRKRLSGLRLEHRELDETISRLAQTPPLDQLQLQRLKRRKLLLKDKIVWLEGHMLPDIIA